MSAILQQFDIVRVTEVVSMGSQTSLTRHHFLIGPTTGSPTDNQFAFEWDAGQGVLFKACVTAAAYYQGSQAQLLRPTPTPAAATAFQVYQAQSAVGSAGFGGRGATPMPGQVRGLVAYKGRLAARGLNPRSYMPFPATGDAGVDAYTPLAAYQTAIGTFGQGVVTFSGINDGAGNIAQATHVDFTPNRLPDYVREFLDQAVVRPRWATQRRSGAYGRQNIPPI